LPIFLLFFFKFNTKFVLRISGLPKLNFLRKYFWKLAKKKLYKITCPTKELKQKLNDTDIFEKNKIFFLQDAIINLKNFKKPNSNLIKLKNIKNKIILSAGRLTNQKNYKYLINEYSEFINYSNNYDLVILGNGEEKQNLIDLINKKNLNDRVHLLGRVSNIYDYMRKAEVFVLSSLWEELGFVIVESAFNNLFVISSNCPNGPSEFIDKNKCGILFNSNSQESLKNALIHFVNENSKKKIQKKIDAKRKSRVYTKFHHHLGLVNILKN
jgi:glycosyltransferase involved in cell wall biosynthesis